MNKLNSILTLIATFGLGVLYGITINNSCDQRLTEPNELREQIIAISESQVDIQEEFLRFYINDYCEENVRAMDVKAFTVMWVGLYCDKDKVMILSDDEPHLPIGTISMSLEATRDNT